VKVKIIRYSFISIIGIALVMSAAGCNKKSGEDNSSSSDTIKIGEIGSMTGTEATFGISTHNAIMLAVEQINAAGGIKGKKLEIITLDDQGKPDEATTAVTKLITQDNVIAILGEEASSRSLAMAPIAQSNHVPMISPASTNPKVTQVGDYIFRVCFIDPFQGAMMAKFAKNNLKAVKVAVLRDVKSDYSMGLANFFVNSFKKLGGEIVLDQSYSAGDVDFKAQLTAIRSRQPDAVFIPGYYTDVGLIARQTRELGIKVPLIGGDGWDSPKLREIGGDAVNNSYFLNHYSTQDQSPAVQDFVSKFNAKYHDIPNSDAALGYDATKILADALNRVDSLDKQKIRDALAVTRDYSGVTGKITMDANRDAMKSAIVIKVADGNFKYQTTIHPD
jgi:branched-chain amino acid transport system substrate-binding protein